jgi:hypothetical protein
MDELFKIFLTSGLTIFGGVLVYVLGQIVSKFYIESIYEQKKIIAEINNVLIFYANQFYIHREFNPKAEKVADEIRSLSTQLRARTESILSYSFFEKCKIVLPKKDIHSASSSLIGLSNSVYYREDISNHVESYKTNIAKKLKIEIDQV